MTPTINKKKKVNDDNHKKLVRKSLTEDDYNEKLNMFNSLYDKHASYKPHTT